MKTLGNIFILLGQLILVSGFVTLVATGIVELVLQCTAISSDGLGSVRCVHHFDAAIAAIDWAKEFLFVAYFAIPLIAIPLMLVGTLFKKIGSAKPHEPSTLDQTVKRLGRIITTCLFVVMSFAFWFISIPVLIYYIYKANNILQGIANYFHLTNPNHGRVEGVAPVHLPENQTQATGVSNFRRFWVIILVILGALTFWLFSGLYYSLVYNQQERPRLLNAQDLEKIHENKEKDKASIR